jgi:hypothetical protein
MSSYDRLPDGAEEWRNKDGQMDREDGPALEWPDGTTEWFRKGQRYREDGPASNTQTSPRSGG